MMAAPTPWAAFAEGAQRKVGPTSPQQRSLHGAYPVLGVGPPSVARRIAAAFQAVTSEAFSGLLHFIRNKYRQVLVSPKTEGYQLRE